MSNFKQYQPLKYMFRNVFEQKEAIKVYLPIENSRKQLKDNIPPRESARTQAVKPLQIAVLRCNVFDVD